MWYYILQICDRGFSLSLHFCISLTHINFFFHLFCLYQHAKALKGSRTRESCWDSHSHPYAGPGNHRLHIMPLASPHLCLCQGAPVVISKSIWLLSPLSPEICSLKMDAKNESDHIVLSMPQVASVGLRRKAFPVFSGSGPLVIEMDASRRFF